MAFEELLNWSTQEGRPLWQRDALRRIALSGKLTDDDLADLKRLVEKHTRERQKALANGPRYEHGPEPKFLV